MIEETKRDRDTCPHQYWDLGYCIDCGIHSNDPAYAQQVRDRWSSRPTERPQALAAVDPNVADPGKPTPRVESSSVSAAEGPSRLRKLAIEAARSRHVTAVIEVSELRVAVRSESRRGGHVWVGGGESYSGFSTCPHPDCVLVRSDGGPSRLRAQIEQLLTDCRTLQASADSLVASTLDVELRTLWRGKSIVYDLVIARLEALVGPAPAKVER